MNFISSFSGKLNFLLCYCFLLTTVTSQASEYNLNPKQYSQTVRGGVGLWQLPTARMATDGSLSVNYTDNDEYRFWSASLQLFPWMESTVRYTDARTRLYSDVPSFSGNQTLKDKGIDVKFRLLEESYYLPNVAVGFMDIGGTGWFASEYITASKAFGPFDFHLGLGWGYLGTADNISNPICQVADSFCLRTQGYSGRGGVVEFGKFFTGSTSLFGGVEYVTPIEGLRLKLEYEAKNYINDRAGNLAQDGLWNIGAVYQWQDFDFSLNYQRGNTIGFGVTYKFNMHSIGQTKIDSAPRSLFDAQPAVSMAELDRSRLYNDMYNQGGFVLSATHNTDYDMTFYGTQINYRDKDQAVERVGRIIASELPDNIKHYRIVENSGTVPMLETVIDAETFKSAARLESLKNDISNSYKRQDTSMDTLNNFSPNRTSGVFYSVDSFWIQTFGSPEDFYLYQGGLFLSGGYSYDKFSFTSNIKATLIENFDKFTFKVDNQDTSVPRVRTYAREYVTRSKVTLETAYLSWFDRIATNTYAQVYVGYLEGMFGGIGGELLYRPVDSNIALGFDVNYVQQRSYENDFDFFDYKVLTGHATLYWQPSFLPDTQIKLSAGQFLAKDKGINIDFAKRFDSGIIVGAYAAFTNVSAEEYGEGSFTKGFYISLPFELFTLERASGRGKLPWIPIARDGGQMLNRPVELRSLTEIRSPFYD